jgi:hypothetical protein
MNVEAIEYILFLVIIAYQIHFFLKTRNKIEEFKLSIPSIKNISLIPIKLNDDEIEEFITHGKVSVNEEHSSDDNNDIKSQRLKILTSKLRNSKTFTNILNSINKYLVRNCSSVADFNLIKDIVERNTDSLEEEINLTISTPLYLGLMGTMLGIVIGLFSMTDVIGTDGGSSDGIAILLGSVKVAMIASFVGLLLTIVNSAIIFKGTKYRVEANKNDLFTLIQVELLPSLNQGMAATFQSLQRNLFSFNEKFDSNLDRLTTVFDKNYESILMQKQLAEFLDKTKMSEMTKYNVQVLRELNIAIIEFEKFNIMFKNINSYLSNSFQLTDKSNELLSRTGNFEVIANTIGQNISQSNELLQFLTTHFSDLKSHSQKVNESVSEVSYGIKDVFDQLKNSLQSESRILNEEAALRNEESKYVFTSFIDQLKKSFEIQEDEFKISMLNFSKELKLSFENQEELFKASIEEKKSNLDYLKFLEPLFTEVKSQNQSQQKGNTIKLSEDLSEMGRTLQNANSILETLAESDKRSIIKKLFNAR